MKFKHAKLPEGHQLKVGSHVKIRKDSMGHFAVYLGSARDHDGIIHTIKGEVAWVQCVAKTVNIEAGMVSNNALGAVVKVPKAKITTTFTVET